MHNKNFYIAIKNTIDYYKEQEKNKDGFYIIYTEFSDLKEEDFNEYHEDFDYRKIFLRSYYRRYLDTSPSIDFEGKEIHWRERMVADVLFRNLLRQLDDKEPAYEYMVRSDISIYKHQELLEKYDLL